MRILLFFAALFPALAFANPQPFGPIYGPCPMGSKPYQSMGSNLQTCQWVYPGAPRGKVLSTCIKEVPSGQWTPMVASSCTPGVAATSAGYPWDGYQVVATAQLPIRGQGLPGYSFGCFTVPGYLPSDYGGQVFFIFGESLESATWIFQPVVGCYLQTDDRHPTLGCYIESWKANFGAIREISTPILIHGFDQVCGWVAASNCHAATGICDMWQVTTRDMTTGQQTVLNTNSVNLSGAPEVVNLAVGAALESYNVPGDSTNGVNCSVNYPDSGNMHINFTEVSIYAWIGDAYNTNGQQVYTSAAMNIIPSDWNITYPLLSTTGDVYCHPGITVSGLDSSGAEGFTLTTHYP